MTIAGDVTSEGRAHRLNHKSDNFWTRFVQSGFDFAGAIERGGHRNAEIVFADVTVKPGSAHT
jgi:hypothetical protein